MRDFQSNDEQGWPAPHERGRSGRGGRGRRGGFGGYGPDPWSGGEPWAAPAGGPGYGPPGPAGPAGFAAGYGPGPWPGDVPPPWRAFRRLRRGDIRSALLAGLADGPAHGYELIRRLEARSGGIWRPSAGSVYPTLQLLEEEGLITGHDEDGKRVYQLTDTGREQAERAKERDPWGHQGHGTRGKLRYSVAPLVLAVRQVALAGDPAQWEAAVGVLDDARQKLYRILADGVGTSPDEDRTPPAAPETGGPAPGDPAAGDPTPGN